MTESASDTGYGDSAIPNAFAQRIRTERERLRLTLSEFAKCGRVAKTTQVCYERGDRVPSLDYLDGLRAAGVDAWYVLTGESCKELARRQFDGDLLEAILAALETWAHARGEVTSPQLKAKLARIFYDEFARSGSYNELHVQSVLHLVS
jgi:transcriptional regulator with XRE-family HTH domain